MPTIRRHTTGNTLTQDEIVAGVPDLTPVQSTITTEAATARAAEALAVLKANNLSDLANAATARGNLGLGSAATKATSFFVAAPGTPPGVSGDTGNGSALTSLLTQLVGLGLITNNVVASNPPFRTPAGQNLKAWTVDPLLSASSAALTAGVLRIHRVQANPGETITSASVYIGTAIGTSPTGCYIVAYDTTGARLGITADLSATWGSTGVKTSNFGSTFTVPANGIVLLGVMYASASSAPQLAYFGSNSAVQNIGLDGTSGFFGSTTGSGLTTPPATLTVSAGNIPANGAIFVITLA